MRNFLIVVMVSFLPGCVSTGCGLRGSSAHELAVGGWVFDNFDFSQSFTVRRSDGTFTEQRFQVEDDRKPPVLVVLEGTWRVFGKQYWVTYESVTLPSWGALVGTTRRLDIVGQERDSFYYFSRDGAPIVERRIKPREARRFEREPFAFLSAAARQRLEQ